MTGMNRPLTDLQQVSDDVLSMTKLDGILMDVAVQRFSNADELLHSQLGKHLKKLPWRFWQKDRCLLESSPLFDEVHYLTCYSAIVAASGMSPVLHYLTCGATAGFDPHPLFNTRWYEAGNPDIVAEGINPLVHFIKFGGSEGRSPHPLFDTRLYLDAHPRVGSSGLNPLHHYLERGGHAGLRPHWLFDGRAYLENYPDVMRTDATPLLHYLRYGLFTLYKPHWAFDPVYYLRKNPDIAKQGINPLLHFVTQGAREGCDPSPDFRLADYVAGHAEIAVNGENPLLHFVRGCDYERVFGANGATAEVCGEEPLPPQPAPPPATPAPALRDLLDTEFGVEVRQHIVAQFRRFQLPFTAERPDIHWQDAAQQELITELAFLSSSVPASETPDVSIVVPVFNQLGYTLACLHAVLSSPTRYSLEIIIADDCSTDCTGEVFAAGIGHIRHARTSGNKGFIRNCNEAARTARGRYLVFLNNDTFVLPGWLDELIGTLESQPDVGLAGSKLIYPDGRLQEAGGIIWQDASAWNFGRYDEPRKPEYSYLRSVDYVSGASIAVSRKIWEEMNGFDTWYDIAYGEDSDLALRIRHSGRRVVLQPLSMLIHFEGVSSGTDVSQGVKAHQLGNAAKMGKRWKDFLASHRPNGELPVLEKERDITRRVLVIDHCTPTPDQDAGSLTCLEIMRAFKDIGFKVTFVPEDNFLYMPKETRNLQRIGIEAVYYPFCKSVREYLESYGHLFDVVLIFRSGAASRHLATVRELCPTAKILYHTSDLHFLRQIRQMAIEGSSKKKRAQVEQTKATELSLINSVDLTIVHSTYEREILAELAPGANVYVFPWILDTVGRVADFNQRNGLIFLGGYRHPPNVDAVRYFVSEVWSLIRARIPEAVFYVAGSNPPPELLKLDGKDNIVVTDHIEDLQPYFERVRLSVAPIRYGAGIKGKVAMSMAHGVPVVASACAAEGMGLIDGENIVIEDDPREMARKIVEFYHDEPRWLKFSDQGLAFVEDNYDSKLGRKRMAEMVGSVSAGSSHSYPGKCHERMQ
jgi:GT2 family glycosyltransferase/glycosyltransferase involved in cell wall biosynthesis